MQEERERKKKERKKEKEKKKKKRLERKKREERTGADLVFGEEDGQPKGCPGFCVGPEEELNQESCAT